MALMVTLGKRRKNRNRKDHYARRIDEAAADEYCNSAAEEENSITSETEKDAEGNSDGAVDAEKVGNKATREEVERCAGESAENVNA